MALRRPGIVAYRSELQARASVHHRNAHAKMLPTVFPITHKLPENSRLSAMAYHSSRDIDEGNISKSRGTAGFQGRSYFLSFVSAAVMKYSDTK